MLGFFPAGLLRAFSEPQNTIKPVFTVRFQKEDTGLRESHHSLCDMDGVSCPQAPTGDLLAPYHQLWTVLLSLLLAFGNCPNFLRETLVFCPLFWKVHDARLCGYFRLTAVFPYTGGKNEAIEEENKYGVTVLFELLDPTMPEAITP
ncbi:hypothetical protein VULLAG_LOCUS18392 [Vulpes lagopus]